LRSVLLGALLALTLAAPSFAQVPAQRVTIRGAIVALDGNVLTVKSPTSTMKVTLNDGYTVLYMVKSDLSKIAPGSYVGTAAVPQADGSLRALEVQIFGDALKPPEGHRPWDVAPSSTMTNATIAAMSSTTVDKVEGRVLTLKYKDGEQRIFVPANAPVVSFVVADKAALVPGANIIIMNAAKKDDGSLSTSGINVGKDGLVPPM
jgi:hypothetical protein